MAGLAEKRETLALLERKLALQARDSLDAYARYVPVPGVPVNDDGDCEAFYPVSVEPARHHRLINDRLEAVARGEISRLIILAPPGTAKSSYASVLFPTWYLGRRPGANLIAVSYNSDLAKTFGRRCRQIVRSPEYAEVFGVGLTGDNQAVDDWSLTNGASYMAGGILSGITGHRADCIIIDDPVKGREDADSETIRDKTWEAYKSDLRTRLKPKGAIVLILTRWHEDDVAGRILPEDYDGASGNILARDGETWHVLSLQAECERADDPLGRRPGEWMWTDWFSADHWRQEKLSQGARNWAALYQQRPAPEEGDYFRREWFRWYDQAPALASMRIYGASDYATKADGGDWTVHIVVGVDPLDNIYVLDLWRAQADSSVWVEQFLNLCEAWHPLEWAEEGGQIRNSVGPFLDKRMREARIYCYRTQWPSVADKPARAQAIRGRAAMGKVYLPRGAGWAEKFLTELLTFPAGTFDDQVDAFGLIGRILNRMSKGKDVKPLAPVADGLAGVTIDRLWKDRERAGQDW